MKNVSVVIIVFFISLFVYTKLAGPIPFSVSSIVTTKTDTFTVSGEGKAQAIPDIAVVNAGVTAQGTTVKQAQQELNGKINAVIEGIKKLGIDKKDIQTTNYTISPQYDYKNNTQKIIGYQANSNVTIQVRNIDKANEVVDTATAGGANQIGGINFEVADKSKAENEARTKAVEEAKKKAELAAKIAGFSLGRIINYSEDNAGNPRPMMLSAKADTTQIEPGTSEITVVVSLSYEIR